MGKATCCLILFAACLAATVAQQNASTARPATPVVAKSRGRYRMFEAYQATLRSEIFEQDDPKAVKDQKIDLVDRGFGHWSVSQFLYGSEQRNCKGKQLSFHLDGYYKAKTNSSSGFAPYLRFQTRAKNGLWNPIRIELLGGHQQVVYVPVSALSGQKKIIDGQSYYMTLDFKNVLFKEIPIVGNVKLCVNLVTDELMLRTVDGLFNQDVKLKISEAMGPEFYLNMFVSKEERIANEVFSIYFCQKAQCDAKLKSQGGLPKPAGKITA